MPRPRAEPYILVRVKIPADLSHTGRERWRHAQIDAPVAPLVKALQDGGVDMRGSCSGHGALPGDIHLQDGRVLLVVEGGYLVHPVRVLLRAAWQHLAWRIRRWLGSDWPGQTPTPRELIP